MYTRLYDQDSIDDPDSKCEVVYEGLSVQLRPAASGKRIMAYLIDTALVTSIIYVLAIVLGVFAAIFIPFLAHMGKSAGSGAANAAGVGFSILILLAFLMLLLCFDAYFIYFEYNQGTTPGKKIFGLKVVSLNGARLTLGQCVLRDVLRLVDCLMLFPGILSISITQKKQRLGDLMAGTMVVHSKEREEEQDYMYISKADYQLLLELVKPREVDAEACKVFLVFANRCFILRKDIFSPNRHMDYVIEARRYFTEGPPQELDPQTVVLFFAEHCFQSLRQLAKGK